MRDGAAFSVLSLLLISGLMWGPFVALPATAYVWVSGFGAQSTTPAAAMTLVSAGPLEDGTKAYAVGSATPGLSYDALTFTVDGSTLPYVGSCAPVSAHAAGCRGGSATNATDAIRAGDSLLFAEVAQGQTLRVIDARANSVILVLTTG